VLAAAAAASGLMLLGGAVPVAAADVTLNALFMKQASYSEDDVRNMTKDFEAANPGTKVNLDRYGKPTFERTTRHAISRRQHATEKVSVNRLTVLRVQKEVTEYRHPAEQET